MTRRTCDVCGGSRRKAYWRDVERSAIIARCLDCGELFYGNETLPLEWAGPAALLMAVDPGAEGARSG